MRRIVTASNTKQHITSQQPTATIEMIPRNVTLFPRVSFHLRFVFGSFVCSVAERVKQTLRQCELGHCCWANERASEWIDACKLVAQNIEKEKTKEKSIRTLTKQQSSRKKNRFFKWISNKENNKRPCEILLFSSVASLFFVRLIGSVYSNSERERNELFYSM